MRMSGEQVEPARAGVDHEHRPGAAGEERGDPVPLDTEKGRRLDGVAETGEGAERTRCARDPVRVVVVDHAPASGVAEQRRARAVRTVARTEGPERTRPGPRASLHLKRRARGGVPPVLGDTLALAVVAREAANPRFHEREPTAVRQVLRVGREVALEMDHALQQRLEVVRDLGRNAASASRVPRRLPVSARADGTPKESRRFWPIWAAGNPVFAELGRLSDQLIVGYGDPLGFGEGIGPVRSGAPLTTGVDSGHGEARTRVPYLRLGAYGLFSSTEGADGRLLISGRPAGGLRPRTAFPRS